MASAGALATVGATSVTGAAAAPGDGSTVLEVDDPTGDNFGAGGLVHPSDGAFYDGVWDLSRFRVGQDSSNIYFDFEMDALDDVWTLGSGWSHEYFKIFIHDPDAPSDAATATSGLSEALNVSFDEPWHYALLAHGEDYQAVQDPNGNEVVAARDTQPSVNGTTISISIPRDPITDISNVKMAVLVTPYDGTKDGGMRVIESSATKWNIGGGDENTPKVMDMVVPKGESQSDLLSSGSRFDNPSLPYIDLSSSGGSVPEVAGNTPANLDNDDLLEDMDGDGDGDIGDVLTYYNNRNDDAIRNNPNYFDYDGDGSSGTVFDALELYNKIQGL